MEVIHSTVLEPQDIWWERGGLSSPAVVEFAGKYQLLYAALGEDGISRLGLAVSDDGELFKRLDSPIYETPDDVPDARLGLIQPRAILTSGKETIICAIGRTVLPIGTINLKDTEQAVPWKQSIFTLSTKDLRHFRLTGPIMPNLGCDAAVSFPARISSRLWLLQALSGNLMLSNAKQWDEFEGSLQLLSTEGKTTGGILSLGPPPILVENGWLLLYGRSEKNELYLEAALLAKENPLVVLKRSTEPLWRLPTSPNSAVSWSSLLLQRGSFHLYYSAKGTVGLAKFSQESILASLNV
ncbi:hypothetical protein A3F39_04190 [Candidatus Berkelbacteria bacterium RIFCSPHIGHO2_12_FULL_50_11]|nr:MAG: hypothetical protein A3F39_04190 [Candidatus Berkelbacteria bacterium RIFCSPHIGHO2_12_FULL_50_11]